jgi:hypothetical protein
VEVHFHWGVYKSRDLYTKGVGGYCLHRATLLNARHYAAPSWLSNFVCAVLIQQRTLPSMNPRQTTCRGLNSTSHVLGWESSTRWNQDGLLVLHNQRIGFQSCTEKNCFHAPPIHNLLGKLYSGIKRTGFEADVSPPAVPPFRMHALYPHFSLSFLRVVINAARQDRYIYIPDAIIHWNTTFLPSA